jgi:hypothetical protein
MQLHRGSKVSYVLKLLGKHFIDPKRSEILSVFPCTTQIALFWPKLLPAFSSRRLDIPALLKSWQKHYIPYQET